MGEKWWVWLMIKVWDLIQGVQKLWCVINKNKHFKLCNSLYCAYSHIVLGKFPNSTFGSSHCKPLRVVQEIPCTRDSALKVHTQEETHWVGMDLVESGLCCANNRPEEAQNPLGVALGNAICEASLHGWYRSQGWLETCTQQYRTEWQAV